MPSGEPFNKLIAYEIKLSEDMAFDTEFELELKPASEFEPDIGFISVEAFLELLPEEVEMRLVLLSDIHANVTAFEAVLADI